MTIIGPDRPGLVESVSGVVTGHGGNWLQSRMARLAGQFAGIVEVDVPQARADAMTAALRGLEDCGLQLVVKRGHEDTAAAALRRVHLDAVGGDRPGIVHHITEALAARGVNIEELSTELRSAPMSGDPLFAAAAVLQVPPNVSLDELRRALEAIAADLMVDVTLGEKSAGGASAGAH